MKITETISRDCCDPRQDLKPVEGCKMWGRIPDLKFCKHCGAWWKHETFVDAAGSSDYKYRKLFDGGTVRS